ncbi:MMPL family transporter [Thiomicrorhabdus lithotrophica]|uniref:MMPL family transporter n=1 Tax=Thiomicrorhabdus lithotrophica TaxID=2949997 RepID=A0ABY8CG48_9GAMM|nr:MMPL family transporter [Thiomicrorhabdus lithotrophica]WEJ63690.1 MMPL family transporter [Thiomicrorhabdus lithotrophica]
MAHNKTKLLMSWVLISGLVLSGMVYLDFSPMLEDFILLSTSLLVMSLVVGYLLESPKVALLQLGLSIYIVGMTFGGLGWLGYGLTQESLLGLVVLITLMSSNLVHILSTLLREMARGLFQYDAVAEALKLNTSPIFLSNLTTALGFIMAAWVDSSYSSLAWLVVIGVLFSFLITISWLPMVLLNWLLEFRVGNSADRHGLLFLANWLLENPLYRTLIIVLGLLLSVLLIFVNYELLSEFEQLLWLVGIFGVLFLLFWQSLSMALMNLVINFLALLTAVASYVLLTGEAKWVLLLWMVPLGIIVDDGIHFFSRYARAKYTVFSDPKSAVIFAMASVGRPIWITSWVLFSGLAVLLLSESRMVFEASLLTMLALVVATFFILTVLPALLMSSKRK